MEFMMIEKKIPFCCLAVCEDLTRLEAIELSSISATVIPYKCMKKLMSSSVNVLGLDGSRVCFNAAQNQLLFWAISSHRENLTFFYVLVIKILN